MTLPDKLVRWREKECICDTHPHRCEFHSSAVELVEELAEMRANLVKALEVFDDPYDPSFFRAAQRIINGEIPKK